MIKMLWKSIAQDKGCLPLDLLILNVALAFFSAILAVVAFFQLVRIHLREKEWTRQKVLHFMIGTSNTGYFIYFASTHFSTYEKWLCWYHVCGFVLMAYPKILFLAAFLLLLSFWVDVCHQANDEEDDDGENSTQQTLLENSTNKFGSSNTDGNWACCSFQNLHVGSRQNFVVAVVLLVFIVMVSFAMIIWIGARENFINSSIVAQVYEDFIASFLLVGGTLGCYGLLLSRKLRKVWSERASSEMWKVAGLAVTSVICFTSSALVAILTDIPNSFAALLSLASEENLWRSLIPSAFVLWIMLELPPAITHREEQARIIMFISRGTSGTYHWRRPPAVTSSKNQAYRASPM